jgi:hypothetical protein
MKAKTNPEPVLEPALMSIADGCDYLAVSIAEMYRLLGLGLVKGVKAGRRTLLTVPSLKARAASLPRAKIKPPTPKKRKPEQHTEPPLTAA